MRRGKSEGGEVTENECNMEELRMRTTLASGKEEEGNSQEDGGGKEGNEGEGRKDSEATSRIV